MPTCGVLSEVANADDDLCAGVMALVVAWIASPLGAFVFFVLILCIRNAVTPQRPFILSPTTGMAATAVAGAGGTLRAVAINMCLLPGGLAFSGSWLLDGDDKKKERIDKLLKHMDDYDIVLLNELWGCWWSSFHTHFYQRAIERGFHVGIFMDSGNVIVSRFPLTNASQWTFKNASGWQAFVPNGILHAICRTPSGARVHLFSTHLQCTSAPSEEMTHVSAEDEKDEGCMSGLVRALEADNVFEAEQRLQQLHELKNFVYATAGIDGYYMAGGDFNLEGGSKDYSEATKLFGRESVSAPDFKPTYSTRSFLTPPGWRDVIWEANLDHVFTNLEVLEYDVVNSDMSDHFPLHIIAAQPSQPDTTLEIIEEEQPRVKHTGGAMQIAWTRQVSPCANKLHSRIHIMPKHSIQVHAPKVVVPLMFEDIPMSP